MNVEYASGASPMRIFEMKASPLPLLLRSYASVVVGKSVDSVYEFPAKMHDEIVYVLVLLKQGEAKPAARQFFDFLASPDAAAEFQKFGFMLIESK